MVGPVLLCRVWIQLTASVLYQVLDHKSNAIKTSCITEDCESSTTSQSLVHGDNKSVRQLVTKKLEMWEPG